MAGILPPRIWTQQPNQAVPIVWPDGITPIAAYNAANGFVDCSGAAMTRGSAANIGAGKSGLSIKQTAVNTSVYRPIVGLPSVLASYMAVWSGDFVGTPTGSTAKICGISNTASSQSGDLLGVERGSTTDHIQLVGKIGGTGVLRDINVGATAWYGKRVTLVFVNAIPESTFKLFACVDGVVSEYSSSYSGASAPTILGTERLVIGADIVENASRFANVNAALAAFACGTITTNYARSVAQNPWQIFAPMRRNVFASLSGGATNATGSGSLASVGASAPSATGAGSASASAALAAISLTAPTGSASAGVSASASGSFAAVSLSAPSASATASAAASGGLASVTVSAPTGNAAGTRNATASGSFATIALTAPTGSAAGTSAGNAVAFGSLSSISISAPMAVAIGSAMASGGIQSIGITAPNGSASAGSGSATASGALAFVSIAAPTGYASSGLIRAPSGSGPSIIQPGSIRPSQSATSRIGTSSTSRPSNTGGRRY